jgi:glycosyltransferase involved in cell wall biosynthesis
LIGLDPPGNVHVFTNIPYTDAMNVLAHSEFMVLPLASSEVPCGHVTLVAAMHLGKAFVITNSQGVADYVKHGENALAVPHADSGALAQAIEELWGAPERARTMGHRGLEFAQQFCSEARAVRHLRSTLVELGVLPSAAESGVREAAPAQSAP